MEGEKVELGWPAGDENHRDELLHNTITPSPPPAHQHPVTDITGLTGSLNELQQTGAHQGEEIKALWDHSDTNRVALWVAYLLLIGMAIVMIVMVGSHLA